MRYLLALFKTLLTLVSVTLIAVCVIFYLTLQDHSGMENRSSVTAHGADEASDSLANLANKLNNSTGKVKFSFTEAQLDAITNVLSYTVSATQFGAEIGQHQVNFKLSRALNLPFERRYINLACSFSESAEPVPVKLEQCLAGDIQIPTWIIRVVYKIVLREAFDASLANDIETMVHRFKAHNQHLDVTLNIKKGMKDRVLAALHQKAGAQGTLINPLHVEVDPLLVKEYLNLLKQQLQRESNQQQTDLAFYIHKVFYLASLRSTPETAEEENHAALWALTIAFGNHKFGHFIRIPKVLSRSFVRHEVQLAGRNDLSKHFLYSIVLQRLLDKGMGLKVGELKEIIDSNEGGSGYSFVDLAADKAGLKFAGFVLDHPLKAQQKLSTVFAEEMMFPSIEGLKEGYSEAEFKALYGSTEDPRYRLIEQDIEDRLAALPLYN